MKSKILLSIIFFLSSLNVFSQTINLNFEAREQSTLESIQLDSVFIENTTRDTSIILYSPDLTITLDNKNWVSSKPANYADKGIGIKNVYPNPFNEFTNVIINNSESKNVKVSIYSLTGTLVSFYEGYLEKGDHRFQVSTQYPGIYLVYLNDNVQSHKIISQPQGVTYNSIQYAGAGQNTNNSGNSNLILKSSLESNFLHYQGDTLLIEGFANCYSNSAAYYIPTASETYVLDFNPDDNIDPILETNDITLYLNENGNVFIDKSLVVASASDNCSLKDTSLSATSFDCSSIGLQNINVTLIDWAENTTNKNAQISVEDTINPTLSTGNITVELDVNGLASILPSDIVISANDNCSLEDTTLSQVDFDCDDLGIQTIDVVLTDISGNKTETTSEINVIDIIPPTISTKAITVELDENGEASITAKDVIESINDNCLIADTTLSKNVFGYLDIGVQTINVKATDVSENENEVGTEITVVDNISPIFTTKAITVELDENGEAIIEAEDVIVSASDNCALVDTTLSKSTFTCGDIGSLMINVTVIDESGNKTTKTAEITIVDELDPVLVTKSITVELNGSGNATIVPGDVIESVKDNCTIASQEVSKSEFTCNDLGSQTINVTVFDNSGNFTTKTAEVTVEENIKPNLTTKSANFYLDNYGTVTINPKDVVLAASDNCGLADTTLSKDVFTCSDLGSQTINVTLIDNDENTSSSTANITILDIIAPEATPVDINVELDSDGNASITADDVLSSRSDNCSIQSITLSENSFSCSDIGTPVDVTITLTDQSNNKTTVVSTVTVEDKISPSLSVIDRIEVVLDVNQQATINPSDVVLGTSDNCSSTFDTVVSPSTITVTGNQEVTVNVTLTDESGNQTTEQVTVDVVDNITDIQGNVYDVVQIGEQAWMAENLKATQYSDGTSIPLVTDSLTWISHGSPVVAYCYWDNDLDNLETYGVLYSWAAAMNSESGSTSVPSNVQGVCPTGWHIPSDGEWDLLLDYITSQESDVVRVGDTWEDIAPYLKSTTLWTDEGANTGNGTNNYGFNALPGGDRNQHAVYFLLEEAAIFWTSTDVSDHHVRAKQIRYDNFIILDPIDKKRGINVRCVKD